MKLSTSRPSPSNPSTRRAPSNPTSSRWARRACTACVQELVERCTVSPTRSTSVRPPSRRGLPVASSPDRTRRPYLRAAGEIPPPWASRGHGFDFQPPFALRPRRSNVLTTALVRPPVALAIDVFARILTEVGRADDDDLEALWPGLVPSPRP